MISRFPKKEKKKLDRLIRRAQNPFRCDKCGHQLAAVGCMCTCQTIKQTKKGAVCMSRQHHYLKCETEYYQAVEKGIKTFEVRKR